MTYKSPPVGNEISCVMHGISDKTLNNPKFLKETLLKALEKDNFTVLGESSHEFQPQGYTMLVLLSESHATIHTYPEYNSLVFHLYSCRSDDDGGNTFKFLKEKLKPKKVELIERPIKVTESNHQ
ncbi:adenosylmethionine decarboxylase [archaeon]|nr:adenosylmethionine decarboxylase [archaeon]